MKTLRLVWLTIIQLPKNIAGLFQHRREQLVLNEQEAERLDRIRNPSKYRGK